MIESVLLTLLLAIFITHHPMVWILLILAFAAASKLVIEFLFHSFKSYISEKKKVDRRNTIFCSELTFSENKISRTNDDDSFINEFNENLQTIVHQTNRKNYSYWLQYHDIAHIARIKYGYSENSASDVFFCIPSNLETLNKRLIEYKNIVKQKNQEITFTSIISLEKLHWTTLVVAYNLSSKQFRAYYCDSFGTDLPNSANQFRNIKCANKIKELIYSLNKQFPELNEHKKKEIEQDLQRVAQAYMDKKNELVNIPINTDGIMSALTITLGIVGDNIRSSRAKQQNDYCNCGLFALENANKITQMLSKGKSFDEISKELSEYKFDLQEKRKEFAQTIIGDKKWKEDLENGLLCDLLPKLETCFISKVNNVRHF
ncbi:MAG: hypothetical protein LKM44_01040 [Wolbachia endosymbiont of Meromenopon meropis]|nr:hypothetical protein [Wolbachia endosymbiont of Meromenopon meropis]